MILTTQCDFLDLAHCLTILATSLKSLHLLQTLAKVSKEGY